MVLQINPAAALASMPERMRGAMTDQVEGSTPERIIEMMDLLAACRARMRSGSYGRTLVEMTVVRLCRLDQFINLNEVLCSTSDPRPQPPARRSPGQPPKKKAVAQMSDGDEEGSAAKLDETHATTTDISAENVELFWREVRDRMEDIVLTGMLDSPKAGGFGRRTGWFFVSPPKRSTPRDIVRTRTVWPR